MTIETHTIEDIHIAELMSDELLIRQVEDGLDLLGNVYYQGFDRMIIHQKNITDQFFDLKSGIAGEILQKFSNYRVRLAIVGDFTIYNSQSLKDFIYESNKGKSVHFVSNTEAAIQLLAG